MFKKNNNNIKKNEFGDKNYIMKNYYQADQLVVAKFEKISSKATSFGPIVETTEQKYIFEIMQKNSQIKYREIFTGFIADSVDDTKENGIDFKYFDLPYVCQIEKFTDYFPELQEKSLPKLSLIWIQNDINYSKSKVLQK